ncbi:hypothetical protein BX591_104203 [Paraburkholderia bryophila]|uniref:Uncharacterized protein n=1 Tax=Paraburkholderia bryophila TaxID=420952 RepID=A0A329CM06_9BURK|nr:hypothetical protein BX591_104203 [Paraburkholderia bryophila]
MLANEGLRNPFGSLFPKGRATGIARRDICLGVDF